VSLFRVACWNFPAGQAPADAAFRGHEARIILADKTPQRAPPGSGNGSAARVAAGIARAGLCGRRLAVAAQPTILPITIAEIVGRNLAWIAFVFRHTSAESALTPRAALRRESADFSGKGWPPCPDFPTGARRCGPPQGRTMRLVAVVAAAMISGG
jgi:hypothetical protein